MFRTKIRRLIVALCAAQMCMLGSPAWAQDSGDAQETVAPSQAQMTLNDEGVRAMIEGDYAGAVALLERAARQGDVNLIYLNLGRAYQKLGSCKEAREALENAKTAPAVADPPAAEVSKTATSYLAELREECETDSGVEMAGEQEQAPAGAEPAAPIAEPSEPSVGQPADEAGGVDYLGWGTSAAGVALIGGGVALHFVAEGERARVTDAELNGSGDISGISQSEAATIEQEANTLDTIGLAMGVTGGLAAAFGTYLLLTDDSDEGVSVHISGQDASVVWTQRF